MADEAIDLIRRGLMKLLAVADVSPTKDTAYVSSTCLSEVSYDTATKTLTVTFKESGSKYEYYNCPENSYENLVNTFGSVGENYNNDIKGLYSYSRIS